jgi:hypothetical protein
MPFPFMRLSLLLCLPFGCGLCGCGSAEHFDVAPVRGKVLCSGRPVSEGIVQFAPVTSAPQQGNKAARPGKSGAGEIRPDGTFEVSTYELGDGAVVGMCKVMAANADPTKPWPCKLPGPIDFEVKPGMNSIVIELNGKQGKISIDPAE